MAEPTRGLGFERTTMRAVATRAGVDVALIYHDQSLREHALAMIHTALSHEDDVRRLQELHSLSALILAGEVAAEDHRELGATLIRAQLSGLLLMRYLFKVSALAAVDPTVLISAVAPTIELYLTGASHRNG